MAKAANLNIRLGLDSRGLNRGLKNAETKLQQSVRKFGDFGRQMSISVSAPLVGIGTAAVNAFVRFDKLEKALTAVHRRVRFGCILQGPGGNCGQEGARQT